MSLSKRLEIVFSSKNKKTKKITEMEAVKMQHKIEMQKRDHQIQQLQDQLKKGLAVLREDKSIVDAEFVKAIEKAEIVTELNVKLAEHNEILSVELFKSQEQCKKLEFDLGNECKKSGNLAKQNEQLTDRLKAVEIELVDERKKTGNLAKQNEILAESLETVKNDLGNECKKNGDLSKQIKDGVVRRDQLVADLNAQAFEKFNKKQHEEAIELRYKALGIEEFGSKRSHWLGKLWTDISAGWSGLKRFDKALQAVEKAIGFDSSNATAFHNRAVYHEELGNRPKAVDDAKKSIELDPNHSRAEVARCIIARCG